MSLNDVVSAERLHISFFGMRNAGKSSLVNAVTGQDLSVVSDVKGTTTDPVRKAMELLPLGPVVIIDTPGFDDVGMLGELRVKKARKVLAQTDVVILVVDARKGLQAEDEELLAMVKERKLPYLIAMNKADLLTEGTEGAKGETRGRFYGSRGTIEPSPGLPGTLYVSALTGEGVYELKEAIGKIMPDLQAEKFLIADKLKAGDTAVLVIPIDESAPKGRIILPQQLVLRELLDHHMMAYICQDTELAGTLAALKEKPAVVITDSQAFGRVAKVVPEGTLLTSFSILMARYKGNLRQLTEGASMLGSLKNEDKVLISEGCSHHRQCGDIGTVKLPAWIKGFCGAEPSYSFTSGGDFPEDPSDYKLVIHCGGCMLNDKEMKHRLSVAEGAGVPVVNYGIAIAQMHGILRRSLEIFPEMLDLLDDEGRTDE